MKNKLLCFLLIIFIINKSNAQELKTIHSLKLEVQVLANGKFQKDDTDFNNYLIKIDLKNIIDTPIKIMTESAAWPEYYVTSFENIKKLTIPNQLILSYYNGHDINFETEFVLLPGETLTRYLVFRPKFRTNSYSKLFVDYYDDKFRIGQIIDNQSLISNPKILRHIVWSEPFKLSPILYR